MKVLHIINSLDVGGAERLLVDSLIYLRNTYPNVENHVITITQKGDLVENIKKLFYYNHFQLNKTNFFVVANKIRSYAKNNQIRVIHAHLYESCIISRVAAPKKTKLINTYHSGFHHPESIEFSRLRLLIDKITVNKVNTMIFVSGRLKEIHGRKLKLPKNSYVVPNFCSQKFNLQYVFNNKKKLRLVAVGNLKPIKNHLLALKTFKDLHNSKVSLDIYGKGELKDKLQDYITKNNINVCLKGEQKISPTLLSNYDAFLMTSKSEGMPISLIEAIVTGLPSILNDIPELRETAKDSALYFKKDSFEDLKGTLLKIIENKEILKELSQRTKPLAKLYSVNNYILKLCSIYKGD